MGTKKVAHRPWTNVYRTVIFRNVRMGIEPNAKIRRLILSSDRISFGNPSDVCLLC